MPRTELTQEPTSVGDSVRRARQRAGLFQRELAEQVGVRPWHICKVERGTAVPSQVLLGKIAKACSVSVDELLGTAA